mgnify:CR=1 FL=1
MNSNLRTVIGLEIHVELKTSSKMFCRCSADYFGKEPNTHVCPVCLGMPGALPVPNKKAIEWTVLIGKALDCSIAEVSKFDRKHYFYPDLPKGYQISQYDEPIATSGLLSLGNKKFRIHRVHLEEDTGKLLHLGEETLIDFNRSGVPLVEIVTEPDFDNAADVKMFLEELQAIIRALGVSDADMEKGSMRLEPNISLSKTDKLPPYKVEVKNINSFRFVKQAIEYEVERQKEILNSENTPLQETRGYDADSQKTYSQRSKEEAHDYRYFPEPDIPPLYFDKDFIESIKVPELPHNKRDRYASYGLRLDLSHLLSINSGASVAYDSVTKKLENDPISKEVNIYQGVANLIINKKVNVNKSADLLTKEVKDLLSPKKTDLTKLETAIEKVITSNLKAVQDYKKGKTNVIMFLVGQVMREMKGQAEATIVKEELIKKMTT